jgi:hypothetical protein
MKKLLPAMLLLAYLLLPTAAGIEYFVNGSEFSWQAQARLWLANGKTVEGNFTVSDPWLIVLPTTQSHTMPFFWNEITSIEMQPGNNAIIHRSDGSSVKTSFIYGILSGDRLYFYVDEDTGTRDIYVLVFNEREKPTPEFVHVRKVEFLATPQVINPVVFSTYR